MYNRISNRLKTMIIFIDESGIHKKVDHSTFALAYIEFENYQHIEDKILHIEKKLNINYFHWSETVWHVKEKFMEEALKLNFKAKIAIVKNPINPAQEIEKVLRHTIVENNIKRIYIDGQKSKRYKYKIKHILRDKNISVKNLKIVKDEQCAGIRLADMVAGLARSYFDRKHPERFDKFYKKLEKKLIVVIE